MIGNIAFFGCEVSCRETVISMYKNLHKFKKPIFSERYVKCCKTSSEIPFPNPSDTKEESEEDYFDCLQTTLTNKIEKIK